MIFEIEHSVERENRVLKYITEEYSFDTEPPVQEMDFDLVLNRLNLTVLDKKVVQVWGFSGYNEWTKSDCIAPESKKGSLKITNELEYGFSYRIYEKDYPVYVNFKTGWLCFGEPDQQSQAVEFMKGCVAIVHEGILQALWLKPVSLPSLVAQ